MIFRIIKIKVTEEATDLKFPVAGKYLFRGVMAVKKHHGRIPWKWYAAWPLMVTLRSLGKRKSGNR